MRSRETCLRLMALGQGSEAASPALHQSPLFLPDAHTQQTPLRHCAPSESTARGRHQCVVLPHGWGCQRVTPAWEKASSRGVVGRRQPWGVRISGDPQEESHTQIERVWTQHEGRAWAWQYRVDVGKVPDLYGPPGKQHGIPPPQTHRAALGRWSILPSTQPQSLQQHRPSPTQWRPQATLTPQGNCSGFLQPSVHSSAWSDPVRGSHPG